MDGSLKWTMTMRKAKTDLAFKASTAPKRSGYEQDVAYAHAADTVDDVLGDFF